MATFEKTLFYADSKGNKYPRPKGQDKKPKCFRMDALSMVRIADISERNMLFMLYNYPYLYNIFFMADINTMTKSKDIVTPDSNFNKGFKLMHTLIYKGFVRETGNLIKPYAITRKGTISRFTTHEYYKFVPWLFPALVAITLFILSRTIPLKEVEKANNQQPIMLHSDSVLKSVAPIDTGKVKDSSSLPVDATKTQ